MAQITEFIFSIQTNIKLYHWTTKSFARHKAADELVDKILELGDKFMEVYIGKHGRQTLKKPTNIKIMNLDDHSVIDYLDSSIKFLEIDIFKLIKKQDADLLNIRDEMLSTINQTKYLFTLE
jgi:hypothetical protein